MLVIYLLNLLLFMSPTHSFIFNNFRYLTEQLTPFVARAGTRHETLWIDQKLDHFDENENRIWKMRCFRRLDTWKPNGPVYIFIGGEDKASPGFLYTGVAYELAQETNGALYATEHRYYGHSVPIYGNEVKDLKYLSARQALADIANLIQSIKANPMFLGSKIVVIGGSYAGNLATWMRLLYPNLVDAAIASSAPVLAKKDFYEYLEKVSDDFKRYGTESCWNGIKNFFVQCDKLFKTKKGIEQLKVIENICPENDISIPENRQLFFLVKYFTYMNASQYGDTTTIKNICLYPNTRNEASLLKEFGFWSEPWRCRTYDFNDMINYFYKNKIKNITSWLYQTCTEFGYFTSTSSDKHPFTNNVPVSYFIKICTSVFGSDFNDKEIGQGIHDVNNMYGGLKPNVTKVVFVNGDLDPWSRLGVLENLSDDAPAIVIPRASHCRDIFSNKVGDEKELIDARINIKNYIKKWIGAIDFVHK